MALLTLKDVGKIYVSEGNVTVGIRGVNLSFDRGEFVAITGKSGSGKSTLLNVISGMDSYEEGELIIDGQPTSHYLQPDWEAYRQEYISFIFQDYNIIESFTVLQNVELALLDIEDAKERRARAMELIERVGLLKQAKQKGSRLSGGQKQRTVIARALAKNSPIILADEPTGNLDSASSREIIDLLHEVSRDKLVIVVTHNFDDFEAYATRHIRIFDGAVESDHTLVAVQDMTNAQGKKEKPSQKSSPREEARRLARNGALLGRTLFTAKPRLSLFLCLLLLFGTLGVFAVTTMCGEAGVLFEENYMFRHVDGRVVIAKPSGEVISDAELSALATEIGAKSTLHYDVLLDNGIYTGVIIPAPDLLEDYKWSSVHCSYGVHFGDDIIGRYPEAKDEVFLYLPISYRPSVGEKALEVDEILVGRTTYRLVGVKYYYDNNLDPQCLFTEEGFRVATAVHYLTNAQCEAKLTASPIGGGESLSFELYSITPSFDLEEGKIWIEHPDYEKRIAQNPAKWQISTVLRSTYYKYNFVYGEGSQALIFEKTFGEDGIAKVAPTKAEWAEEFYDSSYCLYVSDELIVKIAEEVLASSYRQASLFFADDRSAHDAAERLQEAGYIAVPSDTTYEPDASSAVLGVLSGLMMALVWLLAIVFLAFFINLCSSRTLGAFKGDMAIMRSMGIPVRVIHTGMYVRMLISLIPGFVFVALVAVLIFTTPAFNEFFVYLYAWQYALIFLGMILLTLRITHKQIRRLFGESVKKSLKGGAAE